jgi:hypothetical protein
VLEQFLAAISDFIHDNWVKFLTGLALMAVGWLLGKRRARAEWKNKEFLHRLNVSLNILKAGQPLLIRTILEKACSDIFLNAVAVEKVTAAARKTTEQQPLLPLPKEDYWYYLNAVLNEVAERFSHGELKRDLGEAVRTEKYLICLTSEASGEIRTRKVRAMLIQKRVLESLPAEPPRFEHPSHTFRWQTLKILADEWRKNPHHFLEMDISL